MKTADVITAYLAARRAQGVQLRSSERVLYRLARQTDNGEFDAITAEQLGMFLHGSGPVSSTWKSKHGLLSGLYRFAIARGLATHNPLPQRAPKLPPPHPAYIYTTQEVQRLVEAAASTGDTKSPVKGATYRLLLLLMYGAALRVSEAMGLQLRDVDLQSSTLLIRETKFYKTRWVPIGPRLRDEVANYLHKRNDLPTAKGDESTLLCSRTGHHLWYQDVVTLFQLIRREAGIGIPPGATRPPRMHDLRHTAAMHRLVNWYQQGLDVNKLLPQLSTYMGHSGVASTQRYLHMTPDLLAQASRRFAAYADQGGDHAQS
jgi:integrase/recombinase XerD